jgi:hypothetical protein
MASMAQPGMKKIVRLGAHALSQLLPVGVRCNDCPVLDAAVLAGLPARMVE